MDEELHGKLFNNAAYYDPQNGHRVIEIFPGASLKDVVSHDVPEKALRAWVSQEKSLSGEDLGSSENQKTPFLRLIVCSSRVPSDDIWPLPLSSSTLKLIFSRWHLSPFLLRSICRQIPMAAVFYPDHAQKLSGLMLRTNLSFSWQYSLGAVHDADTNITNCIIFGLTEPERETFLAAFRSTVSKSIDKQIPFQILIPTILMDLAMDALSIDAESRRGSLLQIRMGTGLHGFESHHAQGSNSIARDHLELERLIKFTQSLTALSDACAGIKAVCQMQFRFLDEVRTFRSRTRFKAGQISPLWDQCMQQLKFIEQVLHGINSKIDYTQASTQGQVQTMYSLIEQTESRAHLDYAEASGRIADQSRKIAQLARRDSIDMRIIAAVTLIFLPGTFTATLFSASFFNFQPKTPDLVSRWIWLYCTITTILTAIVLLGWWHFSKQQAEKQEETTTHVFRSHTWLHQLEEKRKDKQRSPEPQSVGPLDLRPYLAGSVAGIDMDSQQKPFFNKRIEYGEMPPTLVRR